MFEDITKPPAPLPTPQLETLQPGVSLLPPLLRKGDQGPGLIVLSPDSDSSTSPVNISEGVPSPLLKWAEEGYTVVEIKHAALSGDKSALDVLNEAVAALSQCSKCEPKDKIGIVSYSPEAWALVAPVLEQVPSILAAVTYIDASHKDTLPTPGKVPTLKHIAGTAGPNPGKKDNITEYHYAQHQSHLFAVPFQEHFHYITESVSYTRNLSFLKPRLGGPYFDLETIWEEHCYYEFADRSVEHTMSTMVQEPYVNHIPTLTGGVGRGKLSQFYRGHFIFNNSNDTELELISRTIGIDRVIDEFIFKFTHDKELDWLVPGIPPTGKKVEVPFTGVVNIRGDRLYHEHIGWDQGTVLRQLGLMPEYLPYPYPLPDGRTPAPGKTFEYRVPIGGTEVAEKMRDRNSVASNQMFDYQVREA